MSGEIRSPFGLSALMSMPPGEPVIDLLESNPCVLLTRFHLLLEDTCHEPHERSLLGSRELHASTVEHAESDMLDYVARYSTERPVEVILVVDGSDLHDSVWNVIVRTKGHELLLKLLTLTLGARPVIHVVDECYVSTLTFIEGQIHRSVTSTLVTNFGSMIFLANRVRMPLRIEKSFGSNIGGWTGRRLQP